MQFGVCVICVCVVYSAYIVWYVYGLCVCDICVCVVCVCLYVLFVYRCVLCACT